MKKITKVSLVPMVPPPPFRLKVQYYIIVNNCHPKMFGRATRHSAAHTCPFRLINAQNGALRPPGHDSFVAHIEKTHAKSCLIKIREIASISSTMQPNVTLK